MISNWSFEAWDEVLEIRSGRGYKEVVSPNGTYPIMGSSGKVMGYATDFICEKGTTIVGRKGTIDNPLYINENFWNVDTAFGLHAKEGLDKRFLFYFCRSFDFKSMDRGSGRPSLVKSDLLKILMPIPPLPEQKAIVKILDEAFAKINQAKANIEKNIENAKDVLTSYLQSKFINNVDGNNFEPLNDICELIVDCEHKTAPTQETGYPSIRTPNIGFGTLILEKVNRVSEETYKKWTRRAIPQPGDLILAREAPAGNIGEIPPDTFVCLGQRTVLIRPQKEKFISKYLAYLILSKDVQKKLLSHSQGATVGHINMRDIRAFKIYNLPSLELQEKIVHDINRILEQIEEVKSKYSYQLNNLVELKKSLLKKAFAGELTKSVAIG